VYATIQSEFEDRRVSFDEQDADLSSGEATVILGAPLIPAFEFHDRLNLLIAVDCEGRHAVFSTSISFRPGNRPDRKPVPNDFAVKQGVAPFGTVLNIGAGTVTGQITMKCEGVPAGVRVDIGIVLARGDKRSPSRMLAFSSVVTTGSSLSLVTIPFGDITSDVALEKSVYPLICVTVYGQLRSMDWYEASPINIIRSQVRVARLTELFALNPGNLSGRQWCSRFPGSNSLAALVEPFRTNATAFIAMLQANGASVVIAATFRPPERAFLMHYSFEIARGGADPATIPGMSGVDIIWDWGDYQASIAAAEQMVQGYGIVYEPALNSNHTRGRAIDVTITNLPLQLRFVPPGGTQTVTVDVSGSSNGATNPKLYNVGAQYFHVFKVVSDPPHWYG